jgi:predicted dehydrogenase
MRLTVAHGTARPAALDLAIVGCGAVVEGLYRGALEGLEARGLARVVALVDPNAARTAALGRRFGSARRFATLEEAVATVHPSLAIVTSPAALHVDHTIAALAAGIHVLCEKPMAVRLDDAERMVTAARDARRILAVGMTRRFYPCVVAAQELIATPALGDDLRFVCREGHVYDWPASTDAAFRRTTAGGGVLVDLGSHVLDMIAALFGAPTVASYADDGHAAGVETNCLIELENPVARGVVQLSWNQPLVRGLQLVGSAAELVLDPGRLDAIRWRPRGGSWRTLPCAATWPADLAVRGSRGTPRTHHDCIYYQLIQVLRAIVHGEPVPVPGDDALATVRAIDACYRQATALRLPWLSEVEQAEADARHWKAVRCPAA